MRMGIMGYFRFVAVAILFVALPLFGQNQNTPEDDTTIVPFQFMSPRANGMGGNHAALADDFDTIFVNPAGFTTAEDQFSVAAISVTFTDNDSILKLLASEFVDPAVYISLLKNRFETGLDVGGPFALGLIKGNFGLGLLNHQYVKVWWDRNNVFVLNANAGEEIVLYAGQSIPFPGNGSVQFTPGYVIKPAMRLVYVPRDIQFMDFRYIMKNLQSQPFETHLGIGLDVGFLLSFFDTVYIAGVCRDVVSPLFVSHYTSFEDFTGSGSNAPVNTTEWIKPTYDFSICIRTKNTIVYETVEDIAFTVDYHLSNFLENPDRNPLLDMSAGIELRLLRAFWLRAGWQKMLPGGGFGIDLGWGQINAAFYGETFGNELSDHQSMSFSFGLTFRY
ncbi:MAG: hypothetical protein LBK61_09525 [Spirochaetaceae bacterium]|nr:hypothetical protein [Spirochaetaceae bacterium]